jgi:transporter family protein
MRVAGTWFSYTLLTILFWSIWAILSKVAAAEIPAMRLQLLFTLGNTLVLVVLLLKLRFRVERNRLGVLYGLLSGVFAGAGNIALYEAFRRGGPLSVVVPLSALYPLVTVVLAVGILKERLNWRQRTGIGLAVLAVSVFST